MAKAVSDVVSKRDKQVVMEGQEPAEFWLALGGKAPYASDKRSAPSPQFSRGPPGASNAGPYGPRSLTRHACSPSANTPRVQ